MATLLPRFLRRSSRVSAGFASSIHPRSVPFDRLPSPFTHRYYYTSPGRFTSVHGVGSSSEYAKRRKESLEMEFGHILGARSRALFVYARFGPLLALYRASIISFEVAKLTFWHFMLNDVHKRAEKFRETLIRLGPFYIKLGQALSTRPDILPIAYCKELSKLQVVQYGSFISRPANYFGAMTKTTNKKPGTLSIRTQALSSKSLSSFIIPEIANMNSFNRILLAWKILFPKTILVRGDLNAKIARQRLKMVLFSDRCSVSDLAKKKILENVVKTLSEFVDIESKDKVELNVSTDSDIGTLYSVTIPVRRVKPAYQESDENYKGQIVGIEYKDAGEKTGAVDVTFDFYVPNDK